FLVSPHFMFKDIIKQHGMQHPLAGSFTEYNVSHPVARAIYEQFATTLLPLIKDYKCISNIVVANEPQYDASILPDYYNEPWQNWLREKYNNDISELNRVYKSNYASFDEVDIRRTEDEKAKTYDFMLFNSVVFGGWHKFLSDAVHSVAPDIPVSVKIFGWTRTWSEPQLMLRGLGLEQYGWTDLNGCDYNNFLDDGVENLGKLFWYDLMSSYQNVPVVDTEDHIIKDWDQNFYPLYLADYAGQVIYQGAVHGRALSDIWIWARHRDNTALRDSVLYRPDVIQKISYAANDLNRLSYEITSMVNEPAEIGIVASDADWLLNIKGMRATYEAYEASLYLGQKPRFIPDIRPEDVNKYKVVIVPNTVYIKEETLQALKEYVDNGGYLIVMGKDVFTKDEHDLDRDSETGDYILSKAHYIDYDGNANKMTSMTKREFLEKVHEKFTEADASYLKIVDAETGELVPYLECNVGVNDGKVIINLSNCENNEKRVKIYADGQQIKTAKELRSRETVGDTFTIGSYGVITLETELENPFLDTYGHWAEKDILSLGKEGVISGVSPSRYAPQNATTRAEFLTLLTRAAGLEEASYNGEIPDVNADDWYAKTCAAGVKAGIIVSGEDFRPNDEITREEMCKMLVACAEKVSGAAVSGAADISFTDADKIGDTDAVKKAVSMNLMVGNSDGSFAPGNTATRAEAAAVIRRYIDGSKR
ncbi:MAG: S-layer homology domain-containing protein, partial [Monoglobaceae bacterium]